MLSVFLVLFVGLLLILKVLAGGADDIKISDLTTALPDWAQNDAENILNFIKEHSALLTALLGKLTGIASLGSVQGVISIAQILYYVSKGNMTAAKQATMKGVVKGGALAAGGLVLSTLWSFLWPVLFILVGIFLASSPVFKRLFSNTRKGRATSKVE